MGWYGHGDPGWWTAGMVFMGVFWIALIALAVWAVLRMTRRPTDSPPNWVESPRSILDRRFAAGEVDAAEYAERRRVLDGGGVNPDRP